MSVPSKITAGATLAFSETLSGYPATLFSLAFILNLNGALVANVAATPTGDEGKDFAIVADPTTTKLWTPGRYNFAEIATETAGGAVTQVCRGQLSVLPDLAANITPTATMIQLANLDAAIALVVKSQNEEVSFGGAGATQTYKKRDLKDMLDARDRLQARVYDELRQMGVSTQGGAKRIVTQFCA